MSGDLSQSSGPDLKKAKKVKTDAVATVAAAESQPPTASETGGSHTNGLWWNGETPMVRNFDLSELPQEALPQKTRQHTGQHGYTVISSNYAVLWLDEV